MNRSRLGNGNPIGYLFNRELYDYNYSWKSIINEKFLNAKSCYRKNLFAHYGCVNAIEFSNDGKYLISGGDDRKVLLWDVDKAIQSFGKPISMKAEHISNVFALAFDNSGKKIFSAGNDDQVIIHDATTRIPLDYFMHDQPVYGISIDPLNDNIFASACDDGKIYIYDSRESSNSDPFCLASSNSAFHSIMFNPLEPRLLVSANAKNGTSLWDIRMPLKHLIKYSGGNSEQCCMNARFNYNGSKILALRRRLPPVLYSTNSPTHLHQFYHSGYYNSCTMKTSCFAGDNDQFIISGSDNFDLFMWKVPDDENTNKWIDKAHLVLKGHRSIVNQVRYNYAHSIIASSGVEKLIKLWSPFALPSIEMPLMRKVTYEKERKVYTHDEYINLFMAVTFDNTIKSTREDSRMMAFFDALIQRDIEGMSESDDASNSLNTSISDDDDVEVERNRNMMIRDEPELTSSDDDILDNFPIAIAEQPASPENNPYRRNFLNGDEEEEISSPLRNENDTNSLNASFSKFRNQNGSEYEDTIMGDDDQNEERQESIITKMILERQDRLRKMARIQQYCLENSSNINSSSVSNSRKRKHSLFSSTSSSLSSVSTSSSSVSSSTKSLKNEINSSDESENNEGPPLKKSLKMDRNLSNSDSDEEFEEEEFKRDLSKIPSHCYKRKKNIPSGNRRNNKLFEYLPLLRYESERRDSTSTTENNYPSPRYQSSSYSNSEHLNIENNRMNEATNSSTSLNNENEPSSSSYNKMSILQKYKSSSSSSNSSSSSSSSSSFSTTSTSTDLSDSDDNLQTSSSSSSDSANEQVNSDNLSSRNKTSIIYPLIQKIEKERLKSIHKKLMRRRKREKANNNNSSSSEEKATKKKKYDSSSSSSENESKSSEKKTSKRDKKVKRRKRSTSTNRKKRQIVPRNSVTLTLYIPPSQQPSTSNQDSGIELSRRSDQSIPTSSSSTRINDNSSSEPDELSSEVNLNQNMSLNKKESDCENSNIIKSIEKSESENNNESEIKFKRKKVLGHQKRNYRRHNSNSDD